MKQAQPFDTMVWLLTGGMGTRGLARLNLHEAAILYRYAKAATIGILEVGRMNGGSTCILAAAAPAVPLLSVDLRPLPEGPCKNFLGTTQAEIAVGNSRAYDYGALRFDFALIDGDHSYDGVKADFWRAYNHFEHGAIIAFHDAMPGAPGTCPGVALFLNELLTNNTVTMIDAADSMAIVRI